jgi:hypothetical protein
VVQPTTSSTFELSSIWELAPEDLKSQGLSLTLMEPQTEPDKSINTPTSSLTMMGRQKNYPSLSQTWEGTELSWDSLGSKNLSQQSSGNKENY